MLAVVFHIRVKGSCMIAIQYGSFNWFWTSTRKLVGFSPSRNSFKMIDNLKKNQKAALNEEGSEEKKPESKPTGVPNFLKPVNKELWYQS